MEDGRLFKHRIGYEELLRIVGRFCDETKFDEVGLLEFEKGFILQGIKVESTSEGYIRRVATHTWSYKEIADMAPQKPEEEADSEQEGSGRTRRR